jgi:hypothetical protein
MSGLDPLRLEPERPDLSSGAAPTTDESPALRDALSVAARISEDETRADEARLRYQAEGLPQLEVDDRLAPMRREDESLHAIHPGAMLEHRSSGDSGAHLVGGTLYVTSQRLVHVAEEPTEVALGDVEEMAIALERLLLIRLRGELDLAIDVAHPRLLRVQIAAAKAAARGTGR